MEEAMTSAEAARLIDWLMAHGHSAQDAVNCIRFIAEGAENRPDHNNE